MSCLHACVHVLTERKFFQYLVFDQVEKVEFVPVKISNYQMATGNRITTQSRDNSRRMILRSFYRKLFYQKLATNQISC